MREVLKPIFSILFMQMVLFDICLADAQSYNPYNQGNTFDVNGVFYRHPTYSGTDTEFKFLGYITATIE